MPSNPAAAPASADDFRVQWVERHTKRTLTPFQAAAVQLICDAMRCGPYDFQSTFRLADWNHGYGVLFRVRGPLSTYDSDGLTALVLGAHERSIRVSIEPTEPGRIAVIMHPRKRDVDRLGGRHPTIEQVLERRRQTVPADQAWGQG